MSHIRVAKGEKGRFKVLHNGIQDGIEVSCHELANKHAKHLKNTRYPAAIVFVWDNILECNVDPRKKD